MQDERRIETAEPAPQEALGERERGNSEPNSQEAHNVYVEEERSERDVERC